MSSVTMSKPPGPLTISDQNQVSRASRNPGKSGLEPYRRMHFQTPRQLRLHVSRRSELKPSLRTGDMTVSIEKGADIPYLQSGAVRLVPFQQEEVITRVDKAVELVQGTDLRHSPQHLGREFGHDNRTVFRNGGPTGFDDEALSVFDVQLHQVDLFLSDLVQSKRGNDHALRILQDLRAARQKAGVGA